MLHTIDLTQTLTPQKYRRKLRKYQAQIRALGYEVYRQQRPVVMVFEGWDAAGKGGAIRRLTERLDPRAYKVHSIAAPKGEDADKHYLYRFWQRLPIQGEFAVFDRSWYGRVLVERIEGFCSTAEWQRAYAEINEFEGQLVSFGTIIFKFWIQISPEEQLARFQEREKTPYKEWKLTDEDWRNREKWGLYEEAVNEMVLKTNRVIAPWTVVPGNDKLYARIEVLKTVVDGLSQELDFKPTPKNLKKLPPVAAPTPIPKWARAQARALNIEI